MSTPASYSFLPWLRTGVARQVTAADLDPTVKARAGVNVALTLTGEALTGPALTHPVTRPVELYGPGNVVGIDPREVIRTEPRDWITNAEPNYLAAVEFYDGDFPWRYSRPGRPDRPAAAALDRADRAGPGRRVRGGQGARGAAAALDQPARPGRPADGRGPVGLGATPTRPWPDRAERSPPPTWVRSCPGCRPRSRPTPTSPTRGWSARVTFRPTRSTTPSWCRYSRPAGWPGLASTRRARPTRPSRRGPTTRAGRPGQTCPTTTGGLPHRRPG